MPRAYDAFMPLPYGGDPDTLADIGRGRLFGGGPRRRWELVAAIAAIVLLVAIMAFLLWPNS
jgi:hypothetical protein